MILTEKMKLDWKESSTSMRIWLFSQAAFLDMPRILLDYIANIKHSHSYTHTQLTAYHTQGAKLFKVFINKFGAYNSLE